MTRQSAQKTLLDAETQQQQLAKELNTIKFIWQGTIAKRYLACGKSSCACHSDPKAKHGPYYYWTTKKRGKTISRSLTEHQAQLLEEWITNRRRLDHIVEEMKKLSQAAYDAILFLWEHEE